MYICKARCYPKFVRWDKLKVQQRQLSQWESVRQKRMNSCSLSPSASMSGKGKRLQTSPRNRQDLSFLIKLKIINYPAMSHDVTISNWNYFSPAFSANVYTIVHFPGIRFCYWEYWEAFLSSCCSSAMLFAETSQLTESLPEILTARLFLQN